MRIHKLMAALAVTAALAACAPQSQKANAATCKIMAGQPVKASVSTEYQGKTYYFCCASCVAKFKAEPEKWIAAGQPTQVELAPQ